MFSKLLGFASDKTTPNGSSNDSSVHSSNDSLVHSSNDPSSYFDQNVYEFDHETKNDLINYNDDSTKISIVFTHGDRLKCLIESLTRNPYSDKRFNNNSVLMLCIKPFLNTTKEKSDFKYSLFLIHNGTNNPNSSITPLIKRSSGNEQLSNEKIFRDVTAGMSSLASLRSDTSNALPPKIHSPHIIFLVNHSLAESDMKSSKRLWYSEPKLINTTNEESALDSGKTVYKVICSLVLNRGGKDSQVMVDNIFISDLLRTRETCVKFMNGFLNNSLHPPNRTGLFYETIPQGINEGKRIFQNDNTNNSKIKEYTIPHELIVLPCSHELKYVNNGKCDGHQSAFSVFRLENKSGCSPDSKNINCRQVNGIEQNKTNFTVNWNYYKEKRRSNINNISRRFKSFGRTLGMSNDNQFCRYSSLIEELIKVYTNNSAAQTSSFFNITDVHDKNPTPTNQNPTTTNQKPNPATPYNKGVANRLRNRMEILNGLKLTQPKPQPKPQDDDDFVTLGGAKKTRKHRKTKRKPKYKNKRKSKHFR